MTPHDLHARRTRLLQRSAALRLRASGELQQMEPALAMGDRLLQAGTWLRRNPVYLAKLAKRAPLDRANTLSPDFFHQGRC